VANADVVKGLQGAFDVLREEIGTFTKFPDVAFDVLHEIAMVQHVEISHALGGIEYVRNHAATEGMGSVVAQERVLCHSVISFTFRHKGFSAPFIVLRTARILADVRRMFAAHEQLVRELAPRRSENVGVGAGGNPVFGPKYQSSLGERHGLQSVNLQTVSGFESKMRKRNLLMPNLAMKPNDTPLGACSMRVHDAFFRF